MKLRLTVLLLFSLFCTALYPALQHRFYSLKTKMPAGLATGTTLPTYYKGYKIDAAGWVKLPECSEPHTFSLLITEDVGFEAKKNTVSYLKLIKDQPFLWYDFTLSFQTQADGDETKKTYSWKIEQRADADVPHRLPDHTIVLLTDPSFIKTVEAENPGVGTVDIALPTIVFKDSVSNEAFQESSLRVHMGPVLDLDSIHRKDNPTCMTRKDAVVISMTKQNYEI